MDQGTILAMGAASKAPNMSYASKDRASAQLDRASDFKSMMKKISQSQDDKRDAKTDNANSDVQKPEEKEQQPAKTEPADKTSDVETENQKTDVAGQQTGALNSGSGAADQAIMMMLGTAAVVQSQEVSVPGDALQSGEVSGFSNLPKMGGENNLTVTVSTADQISAAQGQSNGQGSGVTERLGSQQTEGQRTVQAPVKAVEQDQSMSKSTETQQKVSSQIGKADLTAETGRTEGGEVEKPALKSVDEGLSRSVADAGPEVQGEEIVKIKVGDGALNTQAKDFPKALAQTITRHVENGKNEFDIQLNPKELGAIHIKLIFDTSGASVLMTCSNAKAQQLLSLNAEQVRSIVQQETGLNTTVQVKEEAQYASDHQNFDDGGSNAQKEAQKEALNQEEQRRRQELETALYSREFRMGFQDVLTDTTVS